MLDILIAVILGIVEGITEWLPISSTGHMILVEQFLHMSTSHEFNSMFRVVIQLGAILAVVVLYFSKLWPFCSPRDGWIKKDTWILWFKVLVAALPAAIIGLPFDDLLDKLQYYKSGEKIEAVIARATNGEYEENTIELTLGTRPDNE